MLPARLNSPSGSLGMLMARGVGALSDGGVSGLDSEVGVKVIERGVSETVEMVSEAARGEAGGEEVGLEVGSVSGVHGEGNNTMGGVSGR